MESKDTLPQECVGKKSYTVPRLREWGTVADLTRTGLARPGLDAKSGSVLSQGR